MSITASSAVCERASSIRTRSYDLPRLLNRVDIGEGALDPRFVSLTWYMPLFITWQRERCEERGCDMTMFDRAVDDITNLTQSLLGVP